MLDLAGNLAGARADDPALDGLSLSSPRPLTFMDLVEAVAEFADSEAEVIATVTDIVARGLVRFEGGETPRQGRITY